jgi:hypothetical protein
MYGRLRKTRLLLIIHTEDKVCAECAKDGWKGMKNSYKLDQSFIYQFCYNGYVLVNT